MLDCCNDIGVLIADGLTYHVIEVDKGIVHSDNLDCTLCQRGTHNKSSYATKSARKKQGGDLSH